MCVSDIVYASLITVQTLMSTDIIKYTTTSAGRPERVLHLDALRLYLAITLPMMFVTFAAWYGVSWWANREEKKMLKGRNLSSEIIATR
jgi:hypothetical protein